MQQRLARTRWPNPETVPDWSQGVRSKNAQSLIEYWRREYDWSRFEAEFNRLPQYLTRIDGLDIHFIHVKSKNPNAMPLILTHGWPGSVVEFLKLIGPLTDPVAFGGDVADAFDVVIPSLPGFGFSAKPVETGWTVSRIATAWAELMKRLGYEHWAAQGGDWGAIVTTALGAIRLAGLVGIHLNTQYAFPAQIPDTLSPEERATPWIPLPCTPAISAGRTTFRPRGRKPSGLRWPILQPARRPGSTRSSSPRRITRGSPRTLWAPMTCWTPSRSTGSRTAPPRPAHFAAFEQPEILVSEIRTGIRSLRS